MARCGLYARLSGNSGQGSLEYALGGIVIGLIVLFVTAGFGGGVSKRFHCMTLQVGLVKIDPASQLSMTDAEGCGSIAKNAAPPPAPLPNDPLAGQVRHHIGDGNCSGPNCGGTLNFEGLSMSVPFSLTQEQIDFANANGNQMYLKFDGFGIDFTDNVSIGAGPVGTAQTGDNTISIDTTNLAPGDYQVTFESGLNPNNPRDHDDFEVNNVRIVFDENT